MNKFIQIKTIGALTPRTSRKQQPYMAATIVYQMEGSIGKHTFTSFNPEEWTVGQLAIREADNENGYPVIRNILTPTEYKDGLTKFAKAKVDYKEYLDELFPEETP
tara:strand:+ start:262 stop:579 length:318 start_codon:yes stop_codon:yes gene_type:complete